MAKQLHTWGEIAQYLDVSIDIAKRWALKYGMPVRKFPGVNGTVVADAQQLDAWADRNIRPVRDAVRA